MKTCKICGETKELDQFHVDRNLSHGRKNFCKSCRKEQDARSWNEGTDPRRKHYLRNKYGITIEEYDAMVEEQDNVCAICGKPESTRTRLSVDHNHETGEVRGLLCTRCNRTIGLLEDDYWLVQKAADYLLDKNSVVVRKV